MLRIRLKNTFHGCHYFAQNLHRFQLHTIAKPTNLSAQSFSNYLVNSLGFSHKEALSTCTKLTTKKVNDFKFSDNAISVIQFLKEYGFDDTHLKKSISLFPRILCCKVDKTLKPKFKLLQDEGFSENDIIKVFLMNPRLLHTGMESCIFPAIQSLRGIMGSDIDVITVITRMHWQEFGYVVKNLLPNVSLLTSNGVAIEMIRKQMLWRPGAFLRKPEAFEDTLKRVESKLGIPRDSPRLIYGFNLLSMYSEATIESKCQIFKSFGWTQSDIETTLVKNTCCFSLCPTSMKKKLDFLTNELRLEPAYLISHSAFLTCSLEKRILPRHKIMTILKEKDLLGKNPSFYGVICMSESRFLKTYVLPFKEVHEVYAKHTGCNLKMSSQEQGPERLEECATSI